MALYFTHSPINAFRLRGRRSVTVSYPSCGTAPTQNIRNGSSRSTWHKVSLYAELTEGAGRPLESAPQRLSWVRLTDAPPSWLLSSDKEVTLQPVKVMLDLISFVLILKTSKLLPYTLFSKGSHKLLTLGIQRIKTFKYFSIKMCVLLSCLSITIPSKKVKILLLVFGRIIRH